MSNQLTPQKSDGNVILLVDDDESVRKVLLRQLDGKGFMVLEADSGQQAIAILKQQDHSINLLITDVMMPNMTGPELARQWMEEVPGTLVLFVSGYSESALIGNELLESGRADFLTKPFSTSALLAKVLSLLKPSSPAQIAFS